MNDDTDLHDPDPTPERIFADIATDDAPQQDPWAALVPDALRAGVLRTRDVIRPAIAYARLHRLAQQRAEARTRLPRPISGGGPGQRRYFSSCPCARCRDEGRSVTATE